jgi:hypothetical protein
MVEEKIGGAAAAVEVTGEQEYEQMKLGRAAGRWISSLFLSNLPLQIRIYPYIYKHHITTKIFIFH